MFQTLAAAKDRRPSLRALALAGTALTLIAAAGPSDAAPGTGTPVVNSAADLTNPLDFDGGTLQFNVGLSTGNDATITGAGGTIDTGTFQVTISGVISDAVMGMAGALTKTGTGFLILEGANTYSGGTTVSGGRLIGTTTSLQGNILINTSGGVAVEFSQTADGTYAGDITGGDSTLGFHGGGTTTFTVTGNNSAFTGSTFIEEGTLAISSATNIGTGQIQFREGSVLRITGGVVLNNSVSLEASNGKIEVTGSNLAVLGGVVGGLGGLDKLGTGELVLTNTNTYTGGTNVMAGTLTVTGSITGLTGNVAINAGAVLTGTGTIGGTVSGAGTLASDATDPLTVQSYNASGGIFAATIGALPALFVNGTALLTGGTIFVNTINVDGTLMAGQSFVAVSADAMTGAFGAIGDSSAMFDFTGMTMGTEYIVTAVAAATMGALGETENQREVGETLDDLGMPTDPDLAVVVGQIGVLDEAGVLAALDALAGEINADMPTAPIANAQLFQGSIFQRLGTLGGAGGQSAFSLGQLALADAAVQPEVSVAAAMGGAAGPAATGLWVRAHGLFGQVDGDEDGTGAHDLDHSTAGLMAGYDMALSEMTVVGLGAGYAHSDLDLDEVDQEGSIHSFRIAGYGATRMGALSLRGLVGYAYHDNETERRIVIGRFDRTAEGDYAGHELSAAGEVGYLMSLGGIALEPVAGLAVTHLSDESYEESGAGGAGLDVDSRGTTSVRSTLGARATLVETGAMRLGASLAWAHEWADTERVVDAAFAGGGGAFQIQGAEVSRDSALIGASVGVALGQGVDLTLGYDGQFGTDDMAHGLEAVLKLAL